MVVGVKDSRCSVPSKRKKDLEQEKRNRAKFGDVQKVAKVGMKRVEVKEEEGEGDEEEEKEKEKEEEEWKGKEEERKREGGKESSCRTMYVCTQLIRAPPSISSGTQHRAGKRDFLRANRRWVAGQLRQEWQRHTKALGLQCKGKELVQIHYSVHYIHTPSNQKTS